MSLIKQLWIAVAVLMLLAFAGSFVVSTVSAKHYLEQQLQLKNHDNAASLALSMSQMEKDPVTIELLLAAQFDTGHYQRIKLTDPHGNVIQQRAYEGDGNDGAPAWFIELVTLNAVPGIAQVQDGWHQYGRLQVESHSRFAYAALWEGTLRLLQWFLLAAIVGGLIGTWILKTITRPLGGVVAQAEAIGNRRFITADEPRTLEFRTLARAMNTLSSRVHDMLEKEARQLEEYRRQTQHDKLTGLANREHFLNLLDTALHSPDSADDGALILIRLHNLAEVNRQLGHAKTDQLLKELAKIVEAFGEEHRDAQSGRINNTDFALVLPGNHKPAADTQQLADQLYQHIDQQEQGATIELIVSATTYSHGEERSKLLIRADGALASAEQRGNRSIELLSDNTPPAYASLDEWREAILAAMENDGTHLDSYPVLSSNGKLLHLEAPARLTMDGEKRSAGYFMPWAIRSGLMPKLDLAVTQQALRRIRDEGKPIGINLSDEALRDAWFRSELYSLLQQSREEAQQLWIEMPESVALRDLAEFKALCLALHPIGCHMGLEHVGSGFARIGELHDLGLDYIKIDASLIRDINSNTGNQTFIRGLCTIAHSIGLVVIAEGVRSEQEKACLPELGMDGMTGPAIR